MEFLRSTKESARPYVEDDELEALRKEIRRGSSQSRQDRPMVP